MKLGAKRWCKIQEFLANIKCPKCFSAQVNMTENENENAACEDCGCRFEFDPDVLPMQD